MKSIRILVTDNCNANCPNCINKSIRTTNNFIKLKDFEEICHYFKSNEVRRIRIMGGEPTIHPDFKEIVNIAQSYFERVTVFTNAKNANIKLFKPRELDGINYNFTFASFLTEDKLLPNYPGDRTIEIIIKSNIDLQKTKKELMRINSYNINSLMVSLSLDCTANIFKERKMLVNHFSELQAFCDSQNLEYLSDHSMPICFIYGTKLPIRKIGAFCNDDCAGVIDSSCNLRFCNQYSNDGFSLYDKGKLVPYSLVENHLKLAHYKNQVKALEKVCLECPYYNKYCNGGCFIAKEEISREDILNNTELPLYNF